MEPGESTSPSREDIEQLAYMYWEARGRPEGSPEVDWLRAEQELLTHNMAETVSVTGTESGSTSVSAGQTRGPSKSEVLMPREMAPINRSFEE
jgi:hypothetical protein